MLRAATTNAEERTHRRDTTGRRQGGREKSTQRRQIHITIFLSVFSLLPCVVCFFRHGAPVLVLRGFPHCEEGGTVRYGAQHSEWRTEGDGNQSNRNDAEDKTRNGTQRKNNAIQTYRQSIPPCVVTACPLPSVSGVLCSEFLFGRSDGSSLCLGNAASAVYAQRASAMRSTYIGIAIAALCAVALLAPAEAASQMPGE